MATKEQIEKKFICAECGQKSIDNVCLRCDRICRRCRTTLRSHYLVEGLHFCPNAIFDASGEIAKGV